MDTDRRMRLICVDLCSSVAQGLEQLRRAEEVWNLDCRGLRRIRAVNAVPFDTLREQLADGAFGGVGGIRRAHGFAPFLDCIGCLKHHYHHGPFGHELHQRPEERPLAVNRVKSLSFKLADPPHFHSGYAESGFLDDRDNLAALSGGDRVWFDDCESSFHYLEPALYLFPDVRR